MLSEGFQGGGFVKAPLAYSSLNLKLVFSLRKRRNEFRPCFRMDAEKNHGFKFLRVFAI